jgi:predicted nuclease of predicted toxin-antitoxin system
LKILADENVESAIVSWLREEGHDIFWAAESAPASDDESLIQLAQKEHRILLTNDLDFGELVFRRGMISAGILLMRFDQQFEAARLESLRRHWPTFQLQLPGRFTVVNEMRIRVRPIPSHNWQNWDLEGEEQ